VHKRLMSNEDDDQSRLLYLNPWLMFWQ